MWQNKRLTQKMLVVLLHTKDKEMEREIRETSPFMIATNSIKYLGVTLIKEVEDLLHKNFETLKKETEKGYQKMEGSPMLFDW